jgi:hypothetical protein
MRPWGSFWFLGTLLWALSLAGGWCVLLRHDRTPNFLGSVPATWPADSSLLLDARQPTLLMFAHRNCPCTRTSLGELEQILAHGGGRVAARVVLVAPDGVEPDRVSHDIEARARALPGVKVLTDRGGREARRFGVRTSGHVVLYDMRGRLRFSGGITEGRGHAGDNDGRRTVLAWLQDGVAERRSAPVYGCLLFASEGELEGEGESWTP